MGVAIVVCKIMDRIKINATAMLRMEWRWNSMVTRALLLVQTLSIISMKHLETKNTCM